MNKHAQIFWNFIESIHDQQIPYVIIRGFAHLPERPDTDLDIVVNYENFETFCQIAAQTLTRKSEGPYEDRGFAEYCGMLYQPFFTPAPRDESLPNGCFRLDCYNSFHFSSPYHSFTTFWTLPKVFSDITFQQRKLIGDPTFYIPQPEDEITLLICRNILDFQGKWKAKHLERIKALTPTTDYGLLAHSLSLALPESAKIADSVLQHKFDNIQKIIGLHHV